MKPMVGVSFRWDPELLERVRAVKGGMSLSAFVRVAVVAHAEALEKVGKLASDLAVFPAVYERPQLAPDVDDNYDNWGA